MKASTKIAAIETRYKGYRFRSRLEARWAVFFDALGLRWEYEPEGFVLPSGRRYLPDFRVYLSRGPTWIEIKPTPDNFHGDTWWDEETTEGEFFAGIHYYGDGPRLGGVIYGSPGIDEENFGDWPYVICESETSYYFCECEFCGSIDIQYWGRADRNRHRNSCPRNGKEFDKGYSLKTARLLSAYAAARTARFEHGEAPHIQSAARISRQQLETKP